MLYGGLDDSVISAEILVVGTIGVSGASTIGVSADRLSPTMSVLSGVVVRFDSVIVGEVDNVSFGAKVDGDLTLIDFHQTQQLAATLGLELASESGVSCLEKVDTDLESQSDLVVSGISGSLAVNTGEVGCGPTGQDICYTVPYSLNNWEPSSGVDVPLDGMFLAAAMEWAVDPFELCSETESKSGSKWSTVGCDGRFTFPVADPQGSYPTELPNLTGWNRWCQTWSLSRVQNRYEMMLDLDEGFFGCGCVKVVLRGETEHRGDNIRFYDLAGDYQTSAKSLPINGWSGFSGTLGGERDPTSFRICESDFVGTDNRLIITYESNATRPSNAVSVQIIDI